MQIGQLTVTGNNFTSILLAGRPREVFVKFKDERHHHPCNPHHRDSLEWEIKSEDESSLEHSRLFHHHHDRQFYLVIKWQVEGARDIDWVVIF